jgi:hypothetical protein
MPQPIPKKVAPTTSLHVISDREGTIHFGAVELYRGPFSSIETFLRFLVCMALSFDRLASTRGLIMVNQLRALGKMPAMATIPNEGSHSPALNRGGTKSKKPKTLEGRYRDKTQMSNWSVSRSFQPLLNTHSLSCQLKQVRKQNEDLEWDI